MQHLDPLFSLKKVKKGFIQPQISALVLVVVVVVVIVMVPSVVSLERSHRTKE